MVICLDFFDWPQREHLKGGRFLEAELLQRPARRIALADRR
jgi:hypothetical protein